MLLSGNPGVGRFDTRPPKLLSPVQLSAVILSKLQKPTSADRTDCLDIQLKSGLFYLCRKASHLHEFIHLKKCTRDQRF